MAASRWQSRDVCEQALAQRARLRGQRLHASLVLRWRWVALAPLQALVVGPVCIGNASRMHCARMILLSQMDPTGVARVAGARQFRVLLVGRWRCWMQVRWRGRAVVACCCAGLDSALGNDWWAMLRRL